MCVRLLILKTDGRTYSTYNTHIHTEWQPLRLLEVAMFGALVDRYHQQHVHADAHTTRAERASYSTVAE